MAIYNHLQKLEGMPIFAFEEDKPLQASVSAACRVSVDWSAYETGQTFNQLFQQFLQDPQSQHLQGLLIGDWGGTGEGRNSQPVVEALVNARNQLSNLRALFLGEMTSAESEISWINQSNVSPILNAYPKLEVFYVRGSEALRFENARHQNLKKLVIESGGLGANVVQDIVHADFPLLQFLELWLGSEGYGSNVSNNDLANLFQKGPVQHLRHLGLRDDEKADQTAHWLAQNNLPGQVESLDLSLGNLSDDGAHALLNAPWLSNLTKLDIHHHYVSNEMVEKLNARVPNLIAHDQQEGEDDGNRTYRYIAVAE